jgi:hypothetical protein
MNELAPFNLLHMKARFLPANTVTEEDYAWAVAEVRRMGLDPEAFIDRPTPTSSFPPLTEAQLSKGFGVDLKSRKLMIHFSLLTNGATLAY